jgi:ribosomal protein L11 methyltransferase
MAASSPALVLHFPPGTTAAYRDRLVVALAEHSLLAIQEDDLNAPTTWLAHFASAEERNTALDALRRLPETAGIRFETTEVADEDWARRTQANLPAIRIGRLIVAPPWDLPDPAALETDPGDGAPVVIVIEPSRGFGTGHHQSTRLCLVLLQGRDLAGQTVLDVGTGSGVLSIAAAKLGATLVSAVDVDPDAVENARENIERNGVAAAVEAHVRDFVESPPPPADIVLANLTGTLLARHARTLATLVKPRGSLVVSGFTVDEREMVQDAFSPGLSVMESAEEEGWWALVLRPIPS